MKGVQTIQIKGTTLSILCGAIEPEKHETLFVFSNHRSGEAARIDTIQGAAEIEVIDDEVYVTMAPQVADDAVVGIKYLPMQYRLHQSSATFGFVEARNGIVTRRAHALMTAFQTEAARSHDFSQAYLAQLSLAGCGAATDYLRANGEALAPEIRRGLQSAAQLTAACD